MARISDLLEGGRTFSIELWPPRSETAERRLETALAELQLLRPAFT
jgi:5,10-methylenetetrahydrofolate reductase